MKRVLKKILMKKPQKKSSLNFDLKRKKYKKGGNTICPIIDAVLSKGTYYAFFTQKLGG